MENSLLGSLWLRGQPDLLMISIFHKIPEMLVRRPSTDELKVLRYPFPFKSALSINNDLDSMTWDAFCDWHDYVNGTMPTKYGDGLGLEVADSFWIWSHLGNMALYHGSAHGKLIQSREYSNIVSMIEAGYIDTMHGFGEWREEAGLPRPRLQEALAELGRLGVHPTTYVNHGGLNMRHNMGGVWGYYQEGDLPSSEHYCLDLLLEHGFKYFWTDVFFENEKFGENKLLSKKQAATLAAKYNARRFLKPKDIAQDRALAAVRAALSCNDEDEIVELIANNLLVPVTMRDGNKVMCFKRYRGEYSPDSANFAHQVNAKRLEELIDSEAAAVVYQHFGVWRPMAMPKGYTGEAKKSSRTPLLDENAIWAFRFLAEKYKNKEVFITTTSRLLEYLRIVDNLELDIIDNSEKIVVNIKGVMCPAYGYEKKHAEELQGLSIRSTRPNLMLVDSYGEVVKANRIIDGEGYVYSVPWKCLVYPRDKS